MESHIVSYKNSEIHYLKFGKGTRFLICFHGYGEEAASFLILEKALGNDYTLIAPDLPYHGKTRWNEGYMMLPEDVKNLIELIVPLELQAIALLGFSMGGRITLAMLQYIPSKIDRAVLVAPDGLHNNFWYWFSTQTTVGNKLFGYTMENPLWFFTGMSFLTRFRLLNKSIFKFAKAHLEEQEQRALLFKRWMTMRKFKPRQQDITKVLNSYPIPIRMLFGSYDRVILPKRSAGLNKNNETIKVKVIKAGHQLLKEKHVKDIAALFYE